MDCKIVEEKIIDYMSGDISGPSAEEIATHLQQCENCRKEATILRKTMAALRNGYSEKSLLDLASSETDPVTMTLSPDRLQGLEKARDEWILTHAPAGFSMAEFTSRVLTKPGIPEEEPVEPHKDTLECQAEDAELVESSSDKAEEIIPPVEAPRSRSTVRRALDPDITPVYLTRQKKNDLKRTTMKFKLPLQTSLFHKFRTIWFKPLALSMSCACIAFLAVYVNDFSFVYKDSSLKSHRAKIASTSVSYVKEKAPSEAAVNSSGKNEEPSFEIAKGNSVVDKEGNSLVDKDVEPVTAPSARLLQKSSSRLSDTVDSRTLREISVTEELIPESEEKRKQYLDDQDQASNIIYSDDVSNVDGYAPQPDSIEPGRSSNDSLSSNSSSIGNSISSKPDATKVAESFGANKFDSLTGESESTDISMKSVRRALKKSYSYGAKVSSAQLISQPSAPLKSAARPSTLIISPFDSRQIISISSDDEVKISKEDSSTMDERDSVDGESMHIPFNQASITSRQKILSYYAKRLIESRTTVPEDLLSKLRVILRKEADSLLPLIDKEIERNELATVVEEACK